MMKVNKPGYTTTEFWTTVVAVVVSAIAIFHPSTVVKAGDAGLVQAFSVVAASIASGIYSLSRATVKQAVADNLPPVLTMTAAEPTTPEPPQTVTIEGRNYLLAGLGSTSVGPTPVPPRTR